MDSNVNLKPFQSQALRALHTHDHVILTAPTGDGKSLVFQRYLRENRSLNALLVSPLNALSRQHEQQLVRLGVRASLNEPPRSGVWIVSPEKIRKNEYRLQTKLRWRPDFLIVDEAHCIWEWGEAFRTDFKYVLELTQKFSIHKSFWCSASLPHESRAEILKTLKGSVAQIGTFSLPQQLNFETRLISHSNRIEALVHYCKQRKMQLGIVFFSTRQLVERMRMLFTQLSIPCFVYHAGLSAEERVHTENKIMNASQGVVLATNAFGMGVNIPQLSYSILFQPPFSLLSLVQSMGRATRTHDKAESVVFWHEDDFHQRAGLCVENAKQRKDFEQVREWCRLKADQKAYLYNYFHSNCETIAESSFLGCN